MATSPSTALQIDPALYKPELDENAEDRMTFKLKISERRILESKAKAALMSPTKWLVKKITEEDFAPSESVRGGIKGALSILLDKTRRKAVDDLTRRLGFYDASDLAKDLLYRALDDPEATEEFLFGSLRREVSGPAKAELEEREAPKSRKAA